jgi:membrane protein
MLVALPRPPLPAPARAVAVSWLGGVPLRALARSVWRGLAHRAVLERSAALSYYFLFALFPALLFLTALVAVLPVPGLGDHLLDYLAEVLPAAAAALIRRTVGESLGVARRSLLSLGAVAALWGASGGMTSIVTALNGALAVHDSRPWWRKRLVAMGLTLVFSFFTVGAVLLLVFGERVGQTVAGEVGLGGLFAATWAVARWLAAAGAALVGIALVYRLAPAASPPTRWITPGSLVALAGWLLASVSLRLAVANLGGANAVYGPIAGIILLMLWLYLSGVALLVGAEVDGVILHAAAESPSHPVRAASDLAA